MPVNRILLALLTLSLLNPATGAADDYPRDLRVDVEHYRFHLDLSEQSDLIEGRTEIVVRFLAAGVEELGFDLVGRDAGSETGMEVIRVTRNGADVRHTHAGDRLRIEMATPSAAGEARTFRVDYRGRPADGLIIDENMFGERTFFGDNWPDRARHWLPTVDHVSDKATVEWIVVASDRYQVVGNGRLMEQTDLGDGRRRTHWASAVPIPPKVMVIGVARFAVQHVTSVSGVPVQSWVYPQNREAGFHDYALAERALRFFDTHVGPYPYAKLANVQSKTRYGGMENAGNIFYSERSVRGDRSIEGLIAHEVAHQWFGDAVTERDWHHLWLSEGFATYFTQLYNEHTHGRGVRERGMRSARDTVIGFHRRNPDQALIAEQLTDPSDMLNSNAYQKGAWVLHMLRRQVGDDAFWRGIRDYYREYRHGNALTEDLQRVMEEASGQQLGWFFRQWAYTPGHPVLDGLWSYDAGSGRVEVTLRQTQDPNGGFRFPLDIGIHLDSLEPPQIETVEVDGVEQSFSFAVASEPVELALDPHAWLLFAGDLRKR